MRMSRKFGLSAIAALALSVGGAPVAYATYYCPPKPPPSPSNSKCNAGNGNGNENCDPGNSTLNNRGGDETANPLGVNGGSQDNPGGNNV